jgi:integrase
MSRLFTLGIAQGHCPTNPTTGIRKNEETHRDRFLSERELATLWEYLDKHKNVEAAACVQFILLTGCRPGEAYTMRWADLDRNTGIWRKPASTTKQRKRHVVRLTERATAVLGRLESWKLSAFVFPSPNDARKPRKDKLRTFWKTACKNCDLSDVRLYDCRHSFASWLAMGGATESAIADLLGHSNTQTTRRYVHLAQEHLREKAGLMGDVISKALADYSPDQRALVAERGDGGKVTTFLREIAVGEAVEE